MPKFGQAKFAEGQFGMKTLTKEMRNKTYKTLTLGFNVRGSIKDEIIYRVRTGNNKWGAPLGRPIQDKYDYFVPSSINNPQSEPYRVQWKAAVFKWRYDLTAEEKTVYRDRASRKSYLSGYHLFMREAMKGEVPMFVYRGDPAAYDFVVTDLTTDGAWNELDLSAIVPKGAAAVMLSCHLEGGAVDWTIDFKKNGQTNDINHGGMQTIRANVERHRSTIVALDVDRKIQYKADNESWTTLSIVVRGWWT